MYNNINIMLLFLWCNIVTPWHSACILGNVIHVYKQVWQYLALDADQLQAPTKHPMVIIQACNETTSRLREPASHLPMRCHDFYGAVPQFVNPITMT